MIVLFVVVAMAIVAAVAVLVVRDRPLLVDDSVQGRALRWDARGGVDEADLAEVRFAVALRGYRMSEVDEVLADTKAALVARDAQIAELRRVVAELGGHAPTGAHVHTGTSDHTGPDDRIGADGDPDQGGSTPPAAVAQAPFDAADRP